jgi:hypothetical protein
VFCDAPLTKANASREDTVPQWLQQFLGIANENVQPTLTSPAGVELAKRLHPVDQLRTGGICTDCNNGWMSDLEVENQHTLQALMRSVRTVSSLTRAERRAFARWAIKTAFVLDLGGLESRVPLGQVRELFRNRPHTPEGIVVLARQQPPTLSWYFAENGRWKHAPLTQQATARVSAESYKICIQFADLIFLVAHWPLQSWGFRSEKLQLEKVWPPAMIVKEYVHPEPLDSSSSVNACLRYSDSLSVVPHRGAEGYAEQPEHR